MYGTMITASGLWYRTHSWSKTNWHVREQAHTEASECGNSSSSGGKIAVDLLDAEQVLWIGIAKVWRVWWTHTCSTSLADDIGVDRNDVGHGEEGSQTGSNFRKEERSFTFFGLFVGAVRHIVVGKAGNIHSHGHCPAIESTGLLGS